MLKETLIKIWNKLFPFHNKDRVDDGILFDSTIGNLLQEGDNSPIEIFNEDESDYIFHNVSKPENNISEVLDTAVLNISDVDPVESENTRVKQVAYSGIAHNERSTNAEKDVDVDKLVSLTIDSIHYFDNLCSQMPTDDLKTILDEVSRNLIDNLVMSGCSAINEEPGTYNMARHQLIPFQIVTDGTQYKTIKRIGIEYKGEVKLLAIVEL